MGRTWPGGLVEKGPFQWETAPAKERKWPERSKASGEDRGEANLGRNHCVERVGDKNLAR